MDRFTALANTHAFPAYEGELPFGGRFQHVHGGLGEAGHVALVQHRRQEHQAGGQEDRAACGVDGI